MEEKIIVVGSHQIRLHELTTEDESRIRADSQVFDTKKKAWQSDRAMLDALYIQYSVDSATWPKEWGPLSAENIKKMPAKLTRKIFIECNRLNTLSEDSADFLGPQEQSQQPTPTVATLSST